MRELITFLLSNFTLTLFFLSVISAFFSLIMKRRYLNKPMVIQILFSHFLLFNIGFSFLYNFIMHVFFSEMVARFIGWENSPFQIELGFASLGLAVIGILSFWSYLGFRAATVIAATLFLWGAASVHVYDMITTRNFAPGNAGVIFWSDIFIPLIALLLLYLQYRVTRSESDKNIH